jgi:hypothetical protein
VLAGRSGGTLLGSQKPTHRLTPRALYSHGDDVVELAAIAGLDLDPYQKNFLRDGCGVGADGRWASLEVFIELSRQNGKSVSFEARTLGGLYVFREQLITYTAHKGETALEAFRRIDDMIDSVPELKAEVLRVSRTNGKESIELKTRQRVKFRTRTSGGGRGLAGDCVIIDEVQDADEFEIAALMPIMLAKANPQIWYGGSAGGLQSAVLGRLVKRLAQGDPKLTGWRFAASEDDDPASPKTWAKTNPALGRRIHLDTIAALQRSMPPQRFAQEVLGIGDYPREEGEDWVIPRSKWERTTDAKSEPVGKVLFAVEVKWGREAASIGVCGVRRDGRLHGEVTAHEPGTVWVAKELARQMSRNPNLGVVLDPGGPAGALIGPLRDEGIEAELLDTRDVTQAWGSFYDLVTADEPGWLHRGSPLLTTTVAAASTRKVGDATTWRRQGSVDVSPLLAVNWAAHGLLKHRGQPVKKKAPAPRAAGSAPSTGGRSVESSLAAAVAGIANARF